MACKSMPFKAIKVEEARGHTNLHGNKGAEKRNYFLIISKALALEQLQQFTINQSLLAV